MATKKLMDIAATLNLGAIAGATSAANRSAQTPVGKVMANVVDGQAKDREISLLKEKLEAAGNGELVRRLDPNIVVSGAHANRSAESYATKAFFEIKEEILLSGGNIQPIKVRPIADGKYEIIFGHRRHRACLELGIPVLAMVVDLDDQHAFIEMDRENRGRENLRPIEVGRMYKKALDAGLFSSVRKLAESVNMDHSNLNKAVALARLPEAVLHSFPNQLDLQYADAALLNAEIQKNPDTVTNRAHQVIAMNPRPGYRECLRLLLEGVESKVIVPKRIGLKGAANQAAQVVINPISKTAKIEITNASSALFEKLQQAIQNLIGDEAT